MFTPFTKYSWNREPFIQSNYHRVDCDWRRTRNLVKLVQPSPATPLDSFLFPATNSNYTHKNLMLQCIRMSNVEFQSSAMLNFLSISVQSQPHKNFFKCFSNLGTLLWEFESRKKNQVPKFLSSQELRILVYNIVTPTSKMQLGTQVGLLGELQDKE